MDRLGCGLLEVKFAPDTDAAMEFSGYGAVFGNIDAYGDVIAPGAFAQYLSDASSGRQSWPLMLSQHGGMGLNADDMTPIGVWDELAEDGTGLRVKGRLADTPRGREMYTLLKMGPRAIDGLSIGFIPKEVVPRSKPDEPRRTIKRIDLVEISIVSRPANAKARVSNVKSIEDLATMREIEEFLCDELRLTKTKAVALIARIKGVGPGDPVDAKGGPGDPVAGVSPEAILRAIKTLTN